MRSLPILALLGVLLGPAALRAQDAEPDAPADAPPGGDADADTGADTGEPATPDAAPAPRPEPPGPAIPEAEIVEHAGVGSKTGYARAGVIELGGSAGFSHTGDFTTVAVSPTVGWFFTDNIQLSALINVLYAKAGDDSSTLFNGLLEPSYHLPFGRVVFGFLGIGVGASYLEGPGMGVAIAPRIGANVLIGRSGILTPSFSYLYSSHDAQEVRGMTQVAVTSTIMANIGYTVMW